jgi:hypothetical protein
MHRRYSKFAAAIAFGAWLLNPAAAAAQTAPTLGAAAPFAVLGGSTVTNTGPSVITGDLGVQPGSAVTGFPPGILAGGTIHAADAVALNAQNAVTTAFNSLGAQTCTTDLTGQDLGGLTLTPGVYCFASSAQLTGTLTLNAQGNPAAVFIFKTGSTLTTASNASVAVINGGIVCNVFWQIGSSATLGTNTTFAGNILALTSITLTTGSRVFGRTLARNGAVTLDTNVVDRSACAVICPTITLSPSVLPTGTAGIAYSQTLTPSGGTAPYTFAVAAGALPAGMTLSAAGVLAGTPSAGGAFTFTVRATDANGCFAVLTYTMTVAPAGGCPAITLAPLTLPNATVGTPFSQTLTPSGGTAPYTFVVSAGALPAGLTLTPAGLLSGTPTASGVVNFTIRVTDTNGCFATLAYAMTVVAAVPTMAQWAMVTLAGLLGFVGVTAMRRRYRHAHAPR